MFEKVQQDLLFANNLNLDDLNKVLQKTLTKKVDFADLYLQHSTQNSYFLENNLIKSISSNIDVGLGIRTTLSEQSSLAYTQELTLESMLEAASAASYLGTSENKIVKVGASSLTKNTQNSLYTLSNPIDSLSVSAKLELLKEADSYLHNDPAVSQSYVNLSECYEMILILNSEGTLAVDIRPLVRLDLRVILTENGKQGSGSASLGNRVDHSYYTVNNTIKNLAGEAIRRARVDLIAKPAPAGNMTVVVGSGWPGILLHEAVGHGLEADSNRKKVSIFHDKLGKKVASELCTIVDDGSLKDRRGSLNVDDEGTVTKRNVLIEDGILKGYMQDKLNAKLMNMPVTGNGRRESYQYLPMPRMTNTFMLPGKSTKEEIISSVKDGIYAPDFSSGQVDTTSGNFVFCAKEAYLIENGKITTPVKGATLIGNGLETLNKISMVGNDLNLDPGVGTCGKDGQWVPVGVGQPTLRVDDLTVGGTG